MNSESFFKPKAEHLQDKDAPNTEQLLDKEWLNKLLFNKMEKIWW